MDDLATWLTQIWDEQERIARAVKPLGEVVVMGGRRHPETFGHSRHTFASEDGYPRTLADPEARTHFALHEPASVLARIAADRQILALHSPDSELCFWVNCGPTTHGDYGRECFPQGFACDTVKALASPYADRPGYREAWRPE